VDGNLGLDERLRRVEDTLGIYDLVARYAFAIDDRDFEALGELYTRDAVFAGSVETAVGRDAVVDYLRRQMQRYGPTMHSPHIQTIDWGEPGSASGVVSVHAEQTLDSTLVLVAFRYYDHYRFEEGRWRFVERRLKFLYATPADEWPAIFRTELRRRWPGQAPARADLP
jgi:ketosteroid isomerase-like protein